MKWALLSVWDKTGIVELAQALVKNKFSLMSSGGTGKALEQAKIPFTEVSNYTGFPEMMDGRVKTLHPKVHGGLLGRRQIDDAVMAKYGINRIDLLVVNLYPFEKMSGQALPLDKLIEYIDVGGPAMIRAAAKNFKDVTVVVDPADYKEVIRTVEGAGFTEERRLKLAKKGICPDRCLRCGDQQLPPGPRCAVPPDTLPSVYPRQEASVRREPPPASGCLRDVRYCRCRTAPGKADVV